jgi:hypothetical protein
MPTPPEILFHRYFQDPARHPDDRRVYKGKLDLDKLPKPLAQFLRDVQEALNATLEDEKQGVLEHVNHPPFYFDYIDAEVPNALAFPVPDWSFIGVTMPLVNTLWFGCEALGKSQAIAALLEIQPTPENEEAILTVMFQTQLAFVLGHEYTHHVHGHLSQRAAGPGESFFNEVLSGAVGRLEDQALELDADCYSVYHVLAHMLGGPRRKLAVEMLGCDAAQPSVQDEILFSSFVIAVGAFFHVLPPLSIIGVHNRTHPLQSVRLSWVMSSALTWCRQNDREPLAAYMTKERFNTIMHVVERALLGITGGHDWRAQLSFVHSEQGSNYSKRLSELVEAHVQGL